MTFGCNNLYGLGCTYFFPRAKICSQSHVAKNTATDIGTPIAIQLAKVTAEFRPCFAYSLTNESLIIVLQISEELALTWNHGIYKPKTMSMVLSGELKCNNKIRYHKKSRETFVSIWNHCIDILIKTCRWCSIANVNRILENCICEKIKKNRLL